MSRNAFVKFFSNKRGGEGGLFKKTIKGEIQPQAEEKTVTFRFVSNQSEIIQQILENKITIEQGLKKIEVKVI